MKFFAVFSLFLSLCLGPWVAHADKIVCPAGSGTIEIVSDDLFASEDQVAGEIFVFGLDDIPLVKTPFHGIQGIYNENGAKTQSQFQLQNSDSISSAAFILNSETGEPTALIVTLNMCFLSPEITDPNITGPDQYLQCSKNVVSYENCRIEK